MKDQGHNTGSGSTSRTGDRVPLVQEVLLAEIGDGWSPAQVEIAVDMLGASELRFPPGARRLSPGLVGTVERVRLLGAMLEAVAEHGWRNTTIDEVVVRCNVTRKSFYAHFANMEELYLLCLDSIVTHVRGRVESALSSGSRSWRDTLRLSLTEVLRFAGDEPDAARALIVEARCAFPEAVERHDALLEHFASCFDTQIRDARVGGQAPAITASGIVGGVASVLLTRIVRGETADLDALLPELAYLAMVPYIGHQEARAEVNRFPAQ